MGCETRGGDVAETWDLMLKALKILSMVPPRGRGGFLTNAFEDGMGFEVGSRGGRREDEGMEDGEGEGRGGGREGRGEVDKKLYLHQAWPRHLILPDKKNQDGDSEVNPIESAIKAFRELIVKSFEIHEHIEISIDKECPKQRGNIECGYFVMKCMKDIIKHPEIHILQKTRRSIQIPSDLLLHRPSVDDNQAPITVESPSPHHRLLFIFVEVNEGKLLGKHNISKACTLKSNDMVWSVQTVRIIAYTSFKEHTP
ncbi:hypothetical protein QJS10_CPB14g01281 [Acorus calamus]|uniref:Ubiquitin-like protease family profile domain-containing protein n=1 Tax=Acorus calamus TaxID=4465 RepID=A0AAV9DBZ8_ACOCL|nr:hypothetical protein QJS10_CPB14g01281 [Acorus calamus]